MPILANGINYSTGGPLIKPIDDELFAGKILEAFPRQQEKTRLFSKASATEYFSFAMSRGPEVPYTPSVDLGDPKVAGWTFLVNKDDPQFSDILKTIQPLAMHRGMKNPDNPLIYRNESLVDWEDWIMTNIIDYRGGREKSPEYILIVGNPDQVPFHFQALLDTTASVGRVDFDGSLSSLKTYVDKIIRIEGADAPVVDRKAIVFAPDGGLQDPTYYSRKFMAQPLAEYIQNDCGFSVQAIMGDVATKNNLFTACSSQSPALVYSASHGLGAPDQSLEIQKKYNGAICCQTDDRNPQDRFFTAGDIPFDKPFLEGAVFFQFACFGYGTPAVSDFMHWIGDPSINGKADFVAALPKALLSHPRGPVAYIGHVDTAWIHGFADPDSVDILEHWDSRLSSFRKAVQALLTVKPAGRAMVATNDKYNMANALLTTIWNNLQSGKIKDKNSIKTKLPEIFITRTDAQNYMIFGDPAVRLRIPAS